MTGYAAPIQRLIQELGRLPGIGEKTATRLAMFILRRPDEEARRLAESILDVKEKIRFCSVCFNLAEGELCPVCSDPARDRERICVVEDPDSLTAIEESGSFRGTYHVLHGALAPLDGIGPDQIRIRELSERLLRGGVPLEAPGPRGRLPDGLVVGGEAAVVRDAGGVVEQPHRVGRRARQVLGEHDDRQQRVGYGTLDRRAREGGVGVDP